jgi:hypothetical protein
MGILLLRLTLVSQTGPIKNFYIKSHKRRGGRDNNES